MNGFSNCYLVKTINPSFFFFACLLANYSNWSVICLQIQLYAYDFNICIWEGHNWYHTLLPSYNVCCLGRHFISLILTSSCLYLSFLFPKSKYFQVVLSSFLSSLCSLSLLCSHFCQSYACHTFYDINGIININTNYF